MFGDDFPGLEVTVQYPPADPTARVLMFPKRDYILKPDFEHVREELDRGRNILASVGSVFPPLKIGRQLMNFF